MIDRDFGQDAETDDLPPETSFRLLGERLHVCRTTTTDVMVVAPPALDVAGKFESCWWCSSWLRSGLGRGRRDLVEAVVVVMEVKVEVEEEDVGVEDGNIGDQIPDLPTGNWTV